MHRSLLLFLLCLLLTACDPNKTQTEQPKDTTIISVEQQKRDADALMALENALLDHATVELSEAEKRLTARIEIDSEQNEQLIIDMAKRENASSEQQLIESATLEKAGSEQQLIENAKMESAKAEALLNQ